MIEVPRISNSTPWHVHRVTRLECASFSRPNFHQRHSCQVAWSSQGPFHMLSWNCAASKSSGVKGPLLLQDRCSGDCSSLYRSWYLVAVSSLSGAWHYYYYSWSRAGWSWTNLNLDSNDDHDDEVIRVKATVGLWLCYYSSTLPRGYLPQTAFHHPWCLRLRHHYKQYKIPAGTFVESSFVFALLPRPWAHHLKMTWIYIAARSHTLDAFLDCRLDCYRWTNTLEKETVLKRMRILRSLVRVAAHGSSDARRSRYDHGADSDEEHLGFGSLSWMWLPNSAAVLEVGGYSLQSLQNIWDTEHENAWRRLCLLSVALESHDRRDRRLDLRECTLSQVLLVSTTVVAGLAFDRPGAQNVAFSRKCPSVLWWNSSGHENLCTVSNVRTPSIAEVCVFLFHSNWMEKEEEKKKKKKSQEKKGGVCLSRCDETTPCVDLALLQRASWHLSNPNVGLRLLPRSTWVTSQRDCMTVCSCNHEWEIQEARRAEGPSEWNYPNGKHSAGLCKSREVTGRAFPYGARMCLQHGRVDAQFAGCKIRPMIRSVMPVCNEGCQI